MSQPARRSLLLAAVLAATAMPVACSDDTAAPGPTADATTSTTTAGATTPPTTTPPTPEQEVEAAYIAIMARYFDRLSKPTPGGDFSGHADAHLAFVAEIHQQFAADGHVAAPGPSGQWPIPEVISAEIQGDTASLTVCLVDDSRVLDQTSGVVVDDDVSSKLSVATLKFRDGQWLLANQKLIESWASSSGCQR